MKASLVLKRDKYRSSRGGDGRILNIYCAKCKNLVLTYQKDGHGSLFRLYFDRILTPANLVDLQKNSTLVNSALKCSECLAILATPYIYEKEQRPAFRIIQAAILKRLKK